MHMHNVFYVVIGLLSLIHGSSSEGKDNKGKEFIFGIMNNHPAAIVTAEVFITTDHQTVVEVTLTTPLFDSSFSKTVFVSYGQISRVTLNPMIRGMGTELGQKGIYIKSTFEVTAYAVNKAQATTDAFVLFPVDAIGNLYYVLSWIKDSEFMIVATQDGTTVTINLSNRGSSIHYNGVTYTSGKVLTIKLDKYETFHTHSDTGDFSGTHVESDKEVAVISGNRCIDIYNGACDHVVSQMTPVPTLGKTFVAIGMPNCNHAVNYRVLATEHNTNIRIHGIATHILQRPGDVYTRRITDRSVRLISSDKPAMVAFFAEGGCGGKRGDPAMILLPPVAQFAAAYTFSTVHVPSNPFQNSLTIVIREKHVKGLALDSHDLSTVNWRHVQGSADLKIKDLTITDGPHSIYHLDPSATFLAISSGLAIFNSYGYATGQRLASINSVCIETKATPGDIIDNDCDELIDEEIRDGRDNDGDGLIDEDTGVLFDINECISSPCQHGASCLNLVKAYTCHCRDGYMGRNCEIDINECESSPCQHGGICTDAVDSYVCRCRTGYSGINCQIDIDDCHNNPCMNNGTCIDGIDKWSCGCLSGFTGIHCETDINECSSEPCYRNGTCTNLINEYECQCPNDTKGTNCQLWMDHCISLPCLHEGVCQNDYGGFTCKCPAPWHGDVCEFQTLNRTEVCMDLEYTECSCFTTRLRTPKVKSYKIPSGIVGAMAGLLCTIAFYVVWNYRGNKQLPMNNVHPIVEDNKTNIQDSDNKGDDEHSKAGEKNESPSAGPLHCDCFIDHTGYDHFQRYDEKNNRFRFHNCRHKRRNNNSSKSKVFAY